MRKPFTFLASGDHHFLANGPRFAECKRIHAWIANEVAERKPSVFLSAGDIYDAGSTPDEREAVAEWLTAVAEHCPVILAKGNHDRARDLHLLRRLKTRFPIHVVESAGVIRIDDAAIAVMAWPSRANLAAALPPNAGRELLDEATGHAMRHVLSALGDELAANDGPRVLLGHFMIDGSLTSAGQPLAGGGMKIGLADLALARADIVVSGHIHMPQEWEHEGSRVVMCGSPFRTAFGETEDKSIVSARFEGRKLRKLDRILTPASQMFLLTGAWKDGQLAIAPDRIFDVAAFGALCGSDDLAGSEIRLRYDVTSDRQKEAKAAAKELEKFWRGAGAAHVLLDDQVAPVLRAQSAEAQAVAAATTLPAQIEATWAARGLALEAPRKERLLARLAEVAEAPGAPKNAGTLCHHKITLSGVGVFREKFEMDLDALPGPLVAICGRNGSGKSTLMEILGAGSVYRKMPTRGSILSLAHTRDAYIEHEVENGKSYRIRHALDGVAGVGEVTVTTLDGKPVLPETKVSLYDKWVARAMPDQALTLASTFAPQGSTGLLGMEAGPRKAVLIRSLGVEVLETYAKDARERAAKAAETAKVTKARLEDERARGLSVVDAERQLAAAQIEVTRADEREKAAAEVARAADERLARAREIQAKIDLAQVALCALNERARGCADRARGLDERLANNRKVLEDGERIRAAVAALAGLGLRELDADAMVTAAAKREVDARLDVQIARGVLESSTRVLEGARARVTRLDALLADKATLEAAAARHPELAADLATKETAVRECEATVERLASVALLGAEGRIQQLRQSMTQVADYADASGDQVGEFKEEAMARVYEIARAALDRDGAVEEAARALPAQRKTAIDARASAERDRKTARGALDDCERAMAKLATLASYAQERDEAANAVTEGEAARARAQSELLAHEGASDAARRALVEAQGAVSALAVERETFRPLAARAVALANAEARIAELEMERAEVRTEEAQIAGERSAIVLPEPLGVTLSVLEGEARTARENLSRSGVLRSLAEQDVATRQSNVTAARLSAEKIVTLETERVAASDDAADWTLLGESLGRDGLQAILIDAAGPELTELVNDLLHTCHGPRFSMRIEASRTSADGKKVLDGCEVTVTDAKEGREAPGETFSGGEQAILNEALGLALTVLTCRRSGASRPTLIRDEPTAALDPENGLAYAAMLRRAASYVSAHKILFVTHQAAIAELADGRVDLDGRTSPDAA